MWRSLRYFNSSCSLVRLSIVSFLAPSPFSLHARVCVCADESVVRVLPVSDIPVSYFVLMSNYNTEMKVFWRRPIELRIDLFHFIFFFFFSFYHFSPSVSDFPLRPLAFGWSRWFVYFFFCFAPGSIWISVASSAGLLFTHASAS